MKKLLVALMTTTMLSGPVAAKSWCPCNDQRTVDAIVSILDASAQAAKERASVVSNYPREEMMDKCMTERGDTALCQQIVRRAEALQMSTGDWPLYDVAVNTVASLYVKQEQGKRFDAPPGRIQNTAIDVAWVAEALHHVKPVYRVEKAGAAVDLTTTCAGNCNKHPCFATFFNNAYHVTCQAVLMVDLPRIDKIEANGGTGIRPSVLIRWKLIVEEREGASIVTVGAGVVGVTLVGPVALERRVSGSSENVSFKEGSNSSILKEVKRSYQAGQGQPGFNLCY